MSAEPTHESADGADTKSTEPTIQVSLSRRSIIRASAAAGLTVGGTGAFLLSQSNEAHAEVTGAASAVNNAAASTDDGEITGIDLADDGEGIEIQWEGFSTEDPDFDVTLSAQLTGSIEGEDGTASEVLIGPDVVSTTSGTSGAETHSWNDIWAQSAVDITSHGEIAITDFEADTNGETRTREVQVTLEIDDSAHGDDIGSVTDSATATVDITNIDPDADVGGTVDIEIDE